MAPSDSSPSSTPAVSLASPPSNDDALPDGPAIELRGASVRVGPGTVWSDVSMSMARGEFVALLGANGSGKSTLLKAALGMLPLTAGSISVLGGPAGEAAPCALSPPTWAGPWREGFGASPASFREKLDRP